VVENLDKFKDILIADENDLSSKTQ
jgi:hypothetical protein